MRKLFSFQFSVLSLIALVAGCVRQPVNVTPIDVGIPNFAEVVPGKVYRGGQPDTNGLIYLARTLKVRYIVKLNTESEGPFWNSGEDYVVGKGGEGFSQMRVQYWGLGSNPNAGDPAFEVSFLPISVEEQLFPDDKPLDLPPARGGSWLNWKVAWAVNQAKFLPNTPTNSGCGPGAVFIHCEHGQDRTGLVVAMYRHQVQGWSKAEAEKEMLAHGFHKELRGLWEYWEDKIK